MTDTALNERVEALDLLLKSGIPFPSSAQPVEILSEEDKKVRHLVASYGDEPARIEVTDLSMPILMQVPKAIIEKYPERAYKWLSVRELANELQDHDGMWCLVNRSNHSHAPSGLFDPATGGILFKGQNILAFTWRDNSQALQKAVIREFDLKAQSVEKEKRYHDGSGKEVAVLERTDDKGSGRDETTIEATDYDYSDE